LRSIGGKCEDTDEIVDRNVCADNYNTKFFDFQQRIRQFEAEVLNNFCSFDDFRPFANFIKP